MAGNIMLAENAGSRHRRFRPCTMPFVFGVHADGVSGSGVIVSFHAVSGTAKCAAGCKGQQVHRGTLVHSWHFSHAIHSCALGRLEPSRMGTAVAVSR